jgi:hypothetical protein
MLGHIQTLLNSVNKKQAGFGIVAFCGGFGLGLYLNRRGAVELVIEPNIHVSDDEKLATAYQEASNEIFHTADPAVGTVISPPENDPSIIEVDHERMAHRDQLIREFGYARGMQIYQEEYAMNDDEYSEETADAEVISIFSDQESTWDQEAEEKHRAENDGAYVLSVDEFVVNESEYSQTTLTYYEGDEILCSEDDKPVYNWQEVLGELKFGHGSNDQNIFYVRNHKLKAEYEIIRDRGHFQIEVLGAEFDAGLEREERAERIRKFRPED